MGRQHVLVDEDDLAGRRLVTKIEMSVPPSIQCSAGTTSIPGDHTAALHSRPQRPRPLLASLPTPRGPSRSSRRPRLSSSSSFGACTSVAETLPTPDALSTTNHSRRVRSQRGRLQYRPRDRRRFGHTPLPLLPVRNLRSAACSTGRQSSGNRRARPASSFRRRRIARPRRDGRGPMRCASDRRGGVEMCGDKKQAGVAV